MSMPPIPATTISEALDAFLAEQKARLAERTYRKYESVVELLKLSLESYGWNRLSADETGEHVEGRISFCETFGPEHLAPNVDEFLGHFLPDKIVPSKELASAAETTMKKLVKWLAEQGYTDRETSDSQLERLEADRKMRAQARDLSDALEVFAQTQSGEFVDEGQFEITRVEREAIWVSSDFGSEYGPIRVPAKIAARCEPGIYFFGEVGRRRGKYVLLDAWKAY